MSRYWHQGAAAGEPWERNQCCMLLKALVYQGIHQSMVSISTTQAAMLCLQQGTGLASGADYPSRGFIGDFPPAEAALSIHSSHQPLGRRCLLGLCSSRAAAACHLCLHGPEVCKVLCMQCVVEVACFRGEGVEEGPGFPGSALPPSLMSPPGQYPPCG